MIGFLAKEPDNSGGYDSRMKIKTKLLNRIKKPKKEFVPNPKYEKIVAVCNRYAVLLHILACLGGYFVIEWICRRSFLDTWDYLFERSWVFLYNSFLLFVTTLPVFLVRRRTFLRILIGSAWMFLGIVNGVLLTKRVTPFTGSDLKLFSEGLGVISKYFSVWQEALILFLVLLLLLALIAMFIKGPKYRGKLSYLRNIPLVVAACLLFAGATKIELHKRLLSTYFGNIAFAYLDYGFPYCLSVTFFDTGVSQPTGYNESLIEQIVKSEGKPEESKTEDLPNVIFIQLETFFDPTQVRFLKFSEDPIPYFRSLMKEYSSGFYTVPSVGAGTANTEFETLTGMSMRFFGAGEYPYKGVLKEGPAESAAYIFDSLGYQSHAIHNNEANFYSRRTVFGNIGFDTFISEEYMDTQDDVNYSGWMKDRNLIKYITQAMDSTQQQDFVFTVSVQGHGAYPTEPVLENPKIKVTGAATDGENCAWEYYANQLYEMDQFIEELITALEERGEDTVLFLYGDHLPTMGLMEEDLSSGDLFKTKYVMWDNMGLKRQKKDLNAYQAMAEVMDRIDIHEGTMFRFHQTMQGTPQYQIDMQTLMYDMLYGDQYVYDGVFPYEKKKLKLGLEQIYMTNINQVSEESYYIKGGNYTQSCKAEVNGELVETTYLDPNTLLVQGVQLQEGDRINVAVQSNSSTAKVFARSNKRIYHSKRKGGT